MGMTRQMASSRRSFLASSGTFALMAGSPFITAAHAGSLQGNTRPARLRPFDLADVTLGEGPFLHAQRMTESYLMSLDPDRMLHNFRVNAGLQPKAPVYGGWESEPTWADIHCHGHTLGHYLSACSLAYRSTGRAEFKRRIDYIASELNASTARMSYCWAGSASSSSRASPRWICASGAQSRG